MSRVIGFDFEANRVTAVELIGGRTPTIGATFQDALPSPLSIKHAESLGKWLSDALAHAGFRTTEAVAVLSRGKVNLKSLDVPAGPADELPAMVAFAVEGELAAPGGEGCLDFQSTSRVDGYAVLAAMAGADEVAAVAAMLKSAKLNCRHVAPRAYGEHFAAEQSFERFGHHQTLLVAPQADAVEISTWRTDALTAYRSIPLPMGDDSPKRLAHEVRRTLAAVRSDERPLTVERIGVIGKGAELATSLKDAVKMSVQHVDPCAVFGAADLSDKPGFTAAAVAAWRQLGDGEWPIDFLNPKKPIVKRDSRRPIAIMAASLALLLPIGAFSYGKYLLAVKSNRIAFVAKQTTQLEGELATLQPTLKRHEEIKKWTDGEVNWAHELQVLAAVFPDTADAFLKKIEMRSNENRLEGQKPGSITLEGLARSQSVISAAQTQLASDANTHYSPTPKGGQFTTERTDFPHSFAVDLAVTPLKSSEYLERSAAGHQAHAKSVPAGQRRDPIALGATPVPKAETRGNRTTEATGARASFTASDATGRSDRNNRGSRFGGASAPEPAAPAEDPVQKLVARLKGMSFEEQEKFIASKEVPSFLKNRVRKMLRENKP